MQRRCCGRAAHQEALTSSAKKAFKLLANHRAFHCADQSVSNNILFNLRRAAHKVLQQTLL